MGHVHPPRALLYRLPNVRPHLGAIGARLGPERWLEAAAHAVLWAWSAERAELAAAPRKVRGVCACVCVCVNVNLVPVWWCSAPARVASGVASLIPLHVWYSSEVQSFMVLVPTLVSSVTFGSMMTGLDSPSTRVFPRRCVRDPFRLQITSHLHTQRSDLHSRKPPGGRPVRGRRRTRIDDVISRARDLESSFAHSRRPE